MKKLIKSKLFIMVGMVVLTTSILAGCDSKNLSKEINQNKEKEQKTISVIGSTSVTPVAEKLAEAFEEYNGNIKIEVQGIGSSAGIKSIHDGVADIGMASRNLKEGEKKWNLKENIIAYDGIAVVVHPKNKVLGLDKEIVTKIFKGEITNWKEVGGKDQEILIISREAGSGTRGAFEEIMELREKNEKGDKVSTVKKDALIAEGNGAVKANVAKKEYSIGYISLSYADETVKKLEINKIEATIENIETKKYPVYRPFLMLTNGESKLEVEAYLDFIFSEKGQKIIGEKLIPVK